MGCGRIFLVMASSLHGPLREPHRTINRTNNNNIIRRPSIRKSQLQYTDIVDLGTRKLTGMVKEDQATNPNSTSTSSQPGSTTRKPKTPKKPAYFNSLIDGFNIKLRG